MKKSYVTMTLVLIWVIGLLFSVPLHAQVAGATLTGTITDAQGGAVANAKVAQPEWAATNPQRRARVMMKFLDLVNREMVDLEEPTREDLDYIHGMVRRHVEYTESTRGQYVIENWDRLAAKFVKIMPTDYKRALAEMQKAAETNCPANRDGQVADDRRQVTSMSK